MSFAGVADTHTAIWYLSADPRLSANAKRFLDETEIAGRKIAISSITIAEAALSVAVADTVRSVPRNEVPDMPDRIVAATALWLGVPVVSRDRRIRSANIQTIW